MPRKKREKLKWNRADVSECGRYIIQSDQVRGEPRFYDTEWWNPATEEWETISPDSYTDKRQAKAAAERHANGETP